MYGVGQWLDSHLAGQTSCVVINPANSYSEADKLLRSICRD